MLFFSCLLGLLVFFVLPLSAEQITRPFPVAAGMGTLETGIYPIAAGSDTILCGDIYLQPEIDYRLNVHTGEVTFLTALSCDTLVMHAFVLPSWLTEPAGNPIPLGKKFIYLDTLTFGQTASEQLSQKKITLSGNKSFSFNVGRSGASNFSQGLNVDFDAFIADDIRIRGAISDQIGGDSKFTSGLGTTTPISELDKYFFEIQAKRITARGGDIALPATSYWPLKRIKGISAGYADSNAQTAVDVGRPSGRFASQRLTGIDGRQGPYQAVGTDGLPTAVVAGSEVVYVDGRRLEGGSDKEYVIEYPTGRITFSPRVLITSRSRIEIDFEAALADYEQAVFNSLSAVTLGDSKFRVTFGGRRETDEKNNLRFGSLDQTDIDILRQAGDSSGRAIVSGVIPDTGGSYVFISDTTGHEYYHYVGAGSGDYSLTFSFIGEGRGDYTYLGDGVYQYVAPGGGGYMPIRKLPLPQRDDQFFAVVEVHPVEGLRWRLDYQGDNRDNNLYSSLDDGDNFTSGMYSQLAYAREAFASEMRFRFLQDGYRPLYRVDDPDNARIWALPTGELPGDELRLQFDNSWIDKRYTARINAGYINRKDYLRIYRSGVSFRLFQDMAVTPHGDYQSANGKLTGETDHDGLFEKSQGGISFKPVKRIRVDVEVDRELSKDRYTDIPAVESYTDYSGLIMARNSSLRLSRRMEFAGARLGAKGPQQDKIEFLSEESIGSLNLSLAGTWWRQEKLDSDREDITERLFAVGFHYAPRANWLTINAEYRQNQQSGKAFGYRYIQVADGEGDYRFEDGVYLYDPTGDYIRIREETGPARSISTGEKSHTIILYPGRIPVLKKYKSIASQIALRAQTEISEDMTGKDRRTPSWILPWTSRSGIEYVQRFRKERYSCLLFPSFNFYRLNFTYGNSFEEQETGGLLYRSYKEYDIQAKNRIAPDVRSELGWRQERKDEFGPGLIASYIIRTTYSAGMVVNPTGWQVTPKIGYTRLLDDRGDGEGRGVILNMDAIWRHLKRGEIRFNTEWRSLKETVPFAQPEYLVTDGIRFGLSAALGLVVNYDLGSTWRLTVNLTDRIYENRPAEFTGRGELIARF